ncbi:MAG: hypothetical protein LUI85_15310 [Bacteroides sp.]|nr:hypothetical protein [Bacteroides sp.]
MKTKNVLLASAVILLSTGTLSNLQWSMDKYGLLSNSLSKQVLALASDDKSGDDKKDDDKKDDDKTGDDKTGFKEKKFKNITRKEKEEHTVTTTAGVTILGIKGGTTITCTNTIESIKYLNTCIGEGTLKDCTSSWDEYPM